MHSCIPDWFLLSDKVVVVFPVSPAYNNIKSSPAK